MASKINWESFYNDLPTHVAAALRTARVKPDKLALKTDGEILTIAGITDADLETIRAIYSSEYEKELVVETEKVEAEAKEGEVAEEVKEARKVAKKVRSQKYLQKRKLVDQTKLYSVAEAIQLLGKLAAGSKLKTVELHINTIDTGIRGELKLPHSTGKTVKIAIFDDALIPKLNSGEIDFEMLLATAQDMPKLARFAKILGPKGLMPNPKNGTVTENPEARKAELEKGGTLPYKTEAKFPIIHIALGTITQNASDLAENITESIKGIGVNKIKSAFMTCTHTPSVRISYSEFK